MRSYKRILRQRRRGSIPTSIKTRALNERVYKYYIMCVCIVMGLVGVASAGVQRVGQTHAYILCTHTSSALIGMYLQRETKKEKNTDLSRFKSKF